jgi:hypothetical protein
MCNKLRSELGTQTKSFTHTVFTFCHIFSTPDASKLSVAQFYKFSFRVHLEWVCWFGTRQILIVWSYSISEHKAVSDYSDMATELQVRGKCQEVGEYVTEVRVLCYNSERNISKQWGEYVTVVRGYVTVMWGYVAVMRGYVAIMMGSMLQ